LQSKVKYKSTYAPKVQSQYIKFHINLFIHKSFPDDSWLADCCYQVMQFLAETTKIKKKIDAIPNQNCGFLIKPKNQTEAEPKFNKKCELMLLRRAWASV